MYYNKNSKILVTHVWDWYETDYIIELLKFFKPKTFIYDCSTEYEPSQGFNDEGLIILDKYLLDNKIDSYLLLGTSSLNDYTNMPSILNLKSFKFKFFPYLFLNEVIKHNTFEVPTSKIKHLFINHNNKPHYHRCLLVEKLIEKNLDKVGNFSWNYLTKDYYEKYNNILLDKDFKFVYFKEKKISIKDNYSITQNQYSNPGLTYAESLFDIVSESNIDVKFITEKTYKPLVYGKPFIILSFKGANAHIKSLGFKLFDNIIDYSFDNYDKIEDRVEGLCNELQNLSNQNYEELNNKMKNIVQYNKEKAFIINNNSNNRHNFYNKFPLNLPNYQY